LSQGRFVLAFALAAPALLVGLDLAGTLACIWIPLYGYSIGAGLGAVVGAALGRQLAGGRKRVLGRVAWVLVGLGACGAVWLTLRSPEWRSKCSWRYCARALGPGLDRSPFPLGRAPCSALEMCANEYPFSEEQARELDRKMQQLGCAR